MRIREGKPGTPRTIVLRAGVHFLREPLSFDASLSDVLVTALPNETAWLSGGLGLNTTWSKTAEDSHVLVANLTELVAAGVIEDVTGLFTLEPHTRLTRARYPNADAERASANLDGFQSRRPLALEWWRPPPGKVPSFTYLDLRGPNPSGFQKNDSTMPDYNTYGTGRGGACAAVWGPGSSYWCGNTSAGGWAEVDRASALEGRPNIPVGVTYNTTALPNFGRWRDPVGAVVHAQHSQTWAIHMFEVGSHDATKGELSFRRGGWQGGRNWCRCDQCGYAGPWCAARNDTRLIGGSWYVEGVREELDQPGEFYFDKRTGLLYLWPNGTLDLVVPTLATLVQVKGTPERPARNVTFRGIGFRDTVKTYMEQWGVPSGGDWAVHRGGALLVEGAESVTVEECRFRRLDANAIFLAGYVRDCHVRDSEFAWLGQSAVATWGDSEEWDARAGHFPIGTLLEGNVMRELGIYEKQSSAFGQAKAAGSVLRRNVMFNVPRAAINFNDNLGGGNLVESNLIFSTCRESGDHGPINSWDRQPFLTNFSGGFAPLPTVIRKNFVIANYGGSQGVDNDDGSSFYHIEDNVFYAADGFKMDYGGHDSRFLRNLVVTLPYDGQNCVNIGGFVEGHGDIIENNTCIVMPTEGDKGHIVAHLEECDASRVTLRGNRYFADRANGTVECAGQKVPFSALPRGIEEGSTLEDVPAPETILRWMEAALFGGRTAERLLVV